MEKIRNTILGASSLLAFVLAWGWYLLDILGRGEVFVNLPEFAIHLQEFMARHQELGYQIAPWVVMSVSVFSLIILQWPNALKWKIGFRPIASRLLPPIKLKLIPMREASTELYDELKPTPHFWIISAHGHGQGDSDAILDSIAQHIAEKIEVYGIQPPGTEMQPLQTISNPNNVFENGATIMRSKRYVLPPCTDLKVSKSDLDALLKSLRNGLTGNTRI